MGLLDSPRNRVFTKGQALLLLIGLQLLALAGDAWLILHTMMPSQLHNHPSCGHLKENGPK